MNNTQPNQSAEKLIRKEFERKYLFHDSEANLDRCHLDSPRSDEYQNVSIQHAWVWWCAGASHQQSEVARLREAVTLASRWFFINAESTQSLAPTTEDLNSMYKAMQQALSQITKSDKGT